MIKFDNTEVMNFEGAFRGMRNPLNSWDKADSKMVDGVFEMGEKDKELAQRLIKAGADHRKFLRQILVSVDITAPLYWWKEFDTYKVGTVTNSCSTMHTIHKKEFMLDDFSTDKMSGYARDILEDFIFSLNTYLTSFIGSKDKADWWDIIQSLPSSYNQKRTVTLNYEALRNIYHSRKNHKLDEWRVGFMEWIDTLPYAEELIKI